MNDHRWETKAQRIYAGSKWENKAIAAGRAMDNRLHTVAKGPYGQEAESGSFDIQQWFAWFDGEILSKRGLTDSL